LSASARLSSTRSAAFSSNAASPYGKAQDPCARCKVLSSPSEALSPRILGLIAELDEDWRRLDERIEVVSAEIESLSENDAACQRLMTVPGIGPIISSAVVAAIGTGSGFKQGRDFAAWLGLVPKQESTGDRTKLGRISKRGNKYLRTLFVQAARRRHPPLAVESFEPCHVVHEPSACGHVVATGTEILHLTGDLAEDADFRLHPIG
jgi:transposase